MCSYFGHILFIFWSIIIKNSTFIQNKKMKGIKVVVQDFYVKISYSLLLRNFNVLKKIPIIGEI